MDVAGAAVGVASLGIQVCQGLLDYYQACESYDRDIQDAQKWIVNLQRTLLVLSDLLQNSNVKQDVFQNTQTGLLDCEDGILKLEKKLRKIRKGNPVTATEKTKALGHRLIYPLQRSTIAKLKEIVKDLFDHLLLSIQVLQVDTEFSTQSIALRIDDTATSISTSTRNLESASRAQQAQLARLCDSIEGVHSTNSDIQSELIGLPDKISHAVAGLLSKIQTVDIVDSKQRLQQNGKSQIFDVLNWLKAPDPSPYHLRARRKHTPGTGQWLLKSPEFKGWLAGRYPWLWISGEAGSGKTILCSQAIEYLADHTRHRQAEAMTYFYFDSSAEANCTTTPLQRLLLSLIVQLVDRRDALLLDLYEAYANDIQQVGTLESIVLQLLGLRVRTYIVVDALDECPDDWGQAQDVLDGLHRLSVSVEHVRILTTSRTGLCDGTISVRQQAVAMPITGQVSMQEDLRLFVVERMERSGKSSALNTATRQNLISTILRKAEFSFLSAELMLSQLAQEPLWTNARILQQCSDLPTSMSEVYDAMLSRINASHRDETVALLRWLAYARRPLSISELAEAIDFRASSDTETQDYAGLIKSLLGPCKGLLLFSEAVTDRHDYDYHDNHGTHTVSFIHRSAFDFVSVSGSNSSKLKANAFFDTDDPHAVIASRCIEYLHDQNTSLRLVSPLGDYATRNWRYHLDMARRSRDSNVPQHLDDLERLAESIPTNDETTQARSRSPTGTLTFGALQQNVQSGPNRQILQTRPSDISIRTGNSNAVSQLVRCFTTLLQQACFKGSQKLVSQLLEHGADVNAQSGKFCSALHVAAYYGHVDIVKTLLAAGADVNLEGGWFGTALQAAIAADNEEVVDVLLEHGADVNIAGNPANALEIDGNGSALESPDYYDLPVREIRRVTTE